MRKLVLQMMTTLNGRIDDPDVWLGEIDDDLYTEINRTYDAFDTVLVGRVTYDEMYQYWPGAETEQDGTENSRSLARKMNAYKKFVFSGQNGAKALEWNNAELVTARNDKDIVEFVSDLKSQPGGDINLSGGARLAQTFVRLGLVDRFHFFVHPVVSTGQSWFDQARDKRGMQLQGATAYPSGVVGLYYEQVR